MEGLIIFATRSSCEIAARFYRSFFDVVKYPCSGIILSGGLNTRMGGKDKAFLSVGNQTIIDRLYNTFEGLYNLVLSVKDNGIGFSPKEKQNLFKFGYSTKSKGTGFGLHSCANYLIARNGSIFAHSAGRDKGAEFVVRFALYEAKSIQCGGQRFEHG